MDPDQFQSLFFLVAGFGAIVALLQWRTNHIRLKHELFDRRFEQFVTIKKFLGSIIASGTVDPEEQEKYLAGTKGARFIFDKKISTLLDDVIWPNAVQLNYLNREMERHPPGEQLDKATKKREETFQLLQSHFMKLDEIFEKFLQLPSI